MLDQIMSLASSQASKAMQLLDGVSQNVGNFGVQGYKAVRFDQYLRPDGNVDNTKRTDFSQGDTFLTRRELDVALNGPGLIQVTRQNGQVAYTRNGSFGRNADGMLVTNFGDLVGTGIQIPAVFEKVVIDPDGTVRVIDKKGEAPREVGKLQVAAFPNPEGLKPIGNNLFEETDASGKAKKVADVDWIQQGRLEHSNVNIHYAVEDILRINAAVISNLRVLKVTDEIYKQAIQLRQ